MKKIILSLVAMVIATLSFAQSSLLATLSHEGTVQTFYGAGALKSAHAVATHGDVITLSAGSFLATDITKAITLRGSGMSTNPNTGSEPTILIGKFNIEIKEDVSDRLIIEGIFHNEYIYIYSNIKHPMFLKSRFKSINVTGSSKLINANFIHCKIAGGLSIGNSSTATCLNCVISSPSITEGAESSIEFINCVVRNLGYFYNSSLKNCFICINTDYYKSYELSNTNSAFNNVGINIYSNGYYNKYFFRSIPNNTNKTVTSLGEVMKTFNDISTWNEDETYELTDEAKKQFLGTDGTQIGIYGGNMPFDPTPSNPQITKCQVASKSTADGKLSVDITIKAAE